MVLTSDVAQRTLKIPELQQVNVMWEEVSYGIGTIKPHMRTVYVVYSGEDSLIGAILEENDGLGYNFGEWLNMCCEGTTKISLDRVAELITIEALKTHVERMQALLLLLNTDPETYARQKDAYMSDEDRYDDGQPIEQQELEDLEGIEQEIYYDE